MALCVLAAHQSGMTILRRALIPALAAVLALSTLTTTPGASALARDGKEELSAQRAATPYTPVNDLLWTDPVNRPHGISDQLVRLIDNVPAGQSIETITYFFGSPRVYEALKRAFARGVRIRFIADLNQRDNYAQGRALANLLNANTSDASWLRWVDGSSRGVGGAMHQKTWRFSKVGSASWVTVTGSYNTGDLPDARAYALMFQVVAKEIYDKYATIFADQATDTDETSPFRSYTTSNWQIYFSPLSPKTADADPAMRRLSALPVGPNTVVRVNMFLMWGTRGVWLAKRLVSMARAGTRVEFLAGPSVRPTVVQTMRDGGVKVYPGCFRDGTFTHSKDMTATYLQNGERVYWTWVGSDNWTTGGMDADESVLGLKGKAMYDRFATHFDRIRNRPGGVYSGECQPLDAS